MEDLQQVQQDIQAVKQRIEQRQQMICQCQQIIGQCQQQLDKLAEGKEAERLSLLNQLAGLQNQLAGLENQLAGLENQLAARLQKEVLLLQKEQGGLTKSVSAVWLTYPCPHPFHLHQTARFTRTLSGCIGKLAPLQLNCACAFCLPFPIFTTAMLLRHRRGQPAWRRGAGPW
jgi:hypothetical protein